MIMDQDPSLDNFINITMSLEKETLETYILKGVMDYEPIDVPTYVNMLNPSYFDNPVRGKFFKELMSGIRDPHELMTRSGVTVSNFAHIATPTKVALTSKLVSNLRDMVLDERMEKAFQQKDAELIREITKERMEPYNRDFIKEYNDMKSEFSEIARTGMLGSSTGIKELDKATLGLMPNHIWVCGAYYGVGKTFFAINLINSMLNQDKRVLFFSMEMTASEIIQRLVSLRASISLLEAVGGVTEEKIQQKEKAEQFIFNKIIENKFVIDDSARDCDDMVSKMAVENSREHIDFVALDYIQLLSGKDQYESLREATKNIQQATKETHCTTLILSQINNEAQNAGSKSRVDGFKGAGDIGQIANVAIKIEREKNLETGEWGDFYGLRLTKIRHGKPCTVGCKIQFPGGKIIKNLDMFDVEEDSKPVDDTELFKQLGL